jgi:hypothetical protein
MERDSSRCPDKDGQEERTEGGFVKGTYAMNREDRRSHYCRWNVIPLASLAVALARLILFEIRLAICPHMLDA